ncbi:PLP-dependent transferase [Auriculariales sp. MPI-PUGE-AT-0066]|nr:PLP-dependent transferase [Auriculariales sp. MPI-PUGE-AT-0066]
MSYNVHHEKLADAVNLSHHLSDLARRRQPSSLKALQKYMAIMPPGTIQLAGGMPDPSYFPFATIGGDSMVHDSFSISPPEKPTLASWFWNLFGVSKDKTEPLTIPRFPEHPGDVSLAESLQYGPAVGVAGLQKFLEDFTRTAFPPAYKNWKVLVDVGSTEGWFRCLQTFCNPGELIITEEWTYAAIISQSAPYQVKAVPVAMDSEGMSAVALEELLANWDETARGAKRPHVLYTVPIGQNPCGMTTGIQRKKEIYDICVKYDVIICEDDPYYFLQEGVYKHKSERQTSSKPTVSTDKYLQSLHQSYLTVDYQGRVVRMDTFSKTVAPGSRMGWLTCNAVFAERLERHAESSVQRPSGFAQALVAQLLVKQWGMDNWVRWLHGLQVQYTARRDAVVDALLDGFNHTYGYSDASYVVQGLPLYTCFAHPKLARKIAGGKQIGRLCSFHPPSSGMFVWVTVYFGALPPAVPDPEAPEEPYEHEQRLWVRMIKAGVMVAPGSFFASSPEVPRADEGHYRIAFSMGPHDGLRKGMEIFSKELHGYFEDALKA